MSTIRQIIIWVSIPSFVRLFREVLFIPMQEYKKTLWKIMWLIDYNKADFYADELVDSQIKEISDEIRRIRWELKIKYMMIPLKDMISYLFLNNIDWNKIEEVCRCLTYLSNIVWKSCKERKEHKIPTHETALLYIDKINEILWFNISSDKKSWTYMNFNN